MHTILTLDDDVDTKLRAEARRPGPPFRDDVNDTLRRGLASRRATSSRQNFKIEPRDLGDHRAGMSLNNVAEVIEQIGGSLHQ